MKIQNYLKNMTNKPTWADEFDGIWGHVCMDCDGVGVSLGRELQKSKQFISTKLAEQRKEIIEKIEKEKQNHDGYGKTYLEEIINLIKQD